MKINAKPLVTRGRFFVDYKKTFERYKILL